MPFIDGETLREKLNRETQLGIDEAVKITTEVADALDPDGRRLAVTLTLEGEAADVWVVDLARGVRTRLTSGGGAEYGSVWTPDGRSVAFASEQLAIDLFLRPADASGPARRLLASGFDKVGGAFTPDGDQLLSA